MTAVTAPDIRFLAGQHPSPCVSLFVPVTPGRRAEGEVELRNQIARAEAVLAATADPGTADRLLAPARRLCAGVAREPVHGNGLAHFACAETERTYALAGMPAPLAVVGSVFHILPLLGEDSPGHYFLLALSCRAATLYRGSLSGLRPVAVPHMPDGVEGALRTHDPDEPLDQHTVRRGTSSEAPSIGRGVGVDDRKDDLVRYFRGIDRAIHPILRQERAPLVLAGMDYLLPLYAQANKYPHLITDGVSGHPDHAPASDLHRAAWPLVASVIDGPTGRAVRQFHQFQGTGRAVTDPVELAEVAAAGGLENLLLAPTESPGPSGAGDDPSNLAAVHVLRHGGAAHLVDAAAQKGLSAAGLRWLPRDRHRPFINGSPPRFEKHKCESVVGRLE